MVRAGIQPEVLDYWGRRESDRNDGSPFNNSPDGDGVDIQGSSNDPWLKRIKGLRRSARLLWGNLIKQKFGENRRREFLSPSNEIDFRGG